MGLTERQRLLGLAPKTNRKFLVSLELSPSHNVFQPNLPSNSGRIPIGTSSKYSNVSFSPKN